MNSTRHIHTNVPHKTAPFHTDTDWVIEACNEHWGAQIMKQFSILQTCIGNNCLPYHKQWEMRLNTHQEARGAGRACSQLTHVTPQQWKATDVMTHTCTYIVTVPMSRGLSVHTNQHFPLHTLMPKYREQPTTTKMCSKEQECTQWLYKEVHWRGWRQKWLLADTV